MLLKILLVITIATILPQDLIVLITPVIVWLATGFANWLKAVLSRDEGGFMGSVLVTMIVPIFTFFAALIVDELAKPDLPFLVTFTLGFAGVFINELIKQWKQTKAGIQTKTKKALIG